VCAYQCRCVRCVRGFRWHDHNLYSLRQVVWEQVAVAMPSPPLRVLEWPIWRSLLLKHVLASFAFPDYESFLPSQTIQGAIFLLTTYDPIIRARLVYLRRFQHAQCSQEARSGLSAPCQASLWLALLNHCLFRESSASATTRLKG
jgi:hypothetical protein